MIYKSIIIQHIKYPKIYFNLENYYVHYFFAQNTNNINIYLFSTYETYVEIFVKI